MQRFWQLAKCDRVPKHNTPPAGASMPCMTEEQSRLAVAHGDLFRLGDSAFRQAIRSVGFKNSKGDILFLKRVRRRARWPLTYASAQSVVRPLRLDNAACYSDARCGDEFYRRVLPAKPQLMYRSCGWVSWPIFLGIFFAFDEAVAMVRNHGVRTVSGYRRLVLASAGLHGGRRLPYSPDKVYAGAGFRGWSSFFGIGEEGGFVDFENARHIVRGYDLDTQDHYRECVETGSLSDMPLCPDEVYKDSGWLGWDDFLCG